MPENRDITTSGANAASASLTASNARTWSASDAQHNVDLMRDKLDEVRRLLERAERAEAQRDNALKTAQFYREAHAALREQLAAMTTDRNHADQCVNELRAHADKLEAQRDELLAALKTARSILAPIVHKMNVREHFSEKNTLANVIDAAIARAEASGASEAKQGRAK